MNNDAILDLHNRVSAAELASLLESFGCDRYHKHHFGVSYADIEGR